MINETLTHSETLKAYDPAKKATSYWAWSDNDSDPFADIPGATRPDKALPSRGQEKAGNARKPKTNPESLTRKLWRDRGYIYGRTETLESHFAGGFGIKKDLFGIVDAIAIGHGEVVFLQSTTLKQKSSHLSKIINSSYKIGNGTPTPILDAVREILKTNARLIFCLWHQPGGEKTRWLCEELVITEEVIARQIERKRK